MQHTTPFRSLVTLGLLFAIGCSPAYRSMYKSTQSHSGRPVAAANVKAVRGRDDLVQPFKEIGTYQGQAPTTAEAVEAAKRVCGEQGADLFILNTVPFESEGHWKVDGICAVALGT